ncbi:MAG: hypothetical protein WD342_15775 [Verrucomicrobiales bacterium]
MFGFLVAAVVLAAGTALLSAHDDAPETFEPPFASLDELRFLESGDPLKDWNPDRTWRSTDGRQLRATLQEVAGDAAVLRLENGKTAAVPLERLDEEDRRFVAEWQEISMFFDPGYRPGRNIANTVEAGIRDGAFAKEGRVHETRHFRFECDEALNAEVVRDFSRLFEATYLAVERNPLALAIAEPPAGKFRVRLFSREPDYLAAGGQEDAAGVYLINERTMLVPLSSLGLEPGTRGFRKTRAFDPRTLIHETTHALTHQWLNRVPMWFIEGFAEYVAAIPYRDGVMDFDRVAEGLLGQAERKFGGDPARFALLGPEGLVATGALEFMGREEPAEEPLLLSPVEKFQIEVVKNGESQSPDSEGTSMARNDRNPSTAPGDAEAEETSADPGLPSRGSRDRGPVVVRRYISSMLLVNHFLESGRAGALREYLFAHLHFEWDRNRYLNDYERTYREHRRAVAAQVSEFNEAIDRFNTGIKEYNAAAERFNRNGTGAVPEVPAEPVVPAALEVPEILANPRSPSDLSRADFRARAAERHLSLPPALTLPQPE